MPRTGEIVRPGEEPPQRGLTTKHTTETHGGGEEEQPKVGPKGERVGTNESNLHDKSRGSRLKKSLMAN